MTSLKIDMRNPKLVRGPIKNSL